MADAMFKLDLLGDKKLSAALAAVERVPQRRIMRVAMRESYRMVHRAAKQNAPRDTGALRRGIKLRAIKRNRRKVGVGVFLPDRIKLGLDPDGKWYYPAIVEYGHDNVPPNPFLRNVHDQNKDRVWSRFHRLLWRGILRTWRGLKV